MSSCACSAASAAPVSRPLEAGSRNRILALRFSFAAALFAAAIVSGFTALPEAISRLLFIVSWTVAGYTVAFTALRNLRSGTVFDENFLMTVATLGAFAIGEWAEGASVMLFYNLGELFQESAVRKSRSSIVSLMDVRPRSARLDSDGRIVHPADIAPGTIIRVHPGEIIPLDGIVISGSSDLDASALTGESLPRVVQERTRVFAGSVNGGGVLIIESTALFEETAAAKMLNLVEHAQERKARTEKRITAFARVYTPVVTIMALLLSLGGPVVAYLFGGPFPSTFAVFEPWVYRALVFLVISCPCALVISIPLGYFGGIGGAARHGILVKGADFLDVLTKTRAVVFDKTGTLTRGVFSVTAVRPERGTDELELLRVTALAESRSNHPLSRAVRSYAETRGIEVDDSTLSVFREERGRGISSELHGEVLLAGSALFLQENGVKGVAALPDGTVVHTALGGRYLGSLVLGDSLKPESCDAIRDLHELGVERIVMLTGDTETAAALIARETGITEYESGVLPHEKVARFEAVSDSVKEAHSDATVLFAGDGINDAPVLARSDAGIAMGALGSDAAVEAADIVLMNDNPRSIAAAIRIARKTRTIVTQNIVMAFAVKAVFLAGGAFGIASLWEAVFADVGVALLALANSLRSRR